VRLSNHPSTFIHQGTDDDGHGTDDGGHCVVEVTVEKSCYGHGETIVVDYSSCDLGGGWVALYPASAENGQVLNPNYIDWDWASGSGTTTFVMSRSGVFKVYLMTDSDDYGYIASTSAFRVSRDCFSDGGMPAGHAYDKPVPAPTKPPVKPCDSSITVDGCFNIGEYIDIEFAVCYPGIGDWIGL
jgi:hypothetical protein